MLDRLKYFTIRDICITDLMFYSEENKSDLKEFCTRNGFSYLPSRDRKSCYRLIEDEFERIENIPDSQKCKPQDLIFDKDTVSLFEKGGNHDEVLFVIEDDLIKGVVHIVDYNNDELYVELFRLFLNFENNLRKLLSSAGLKDSDLIMWLKKKGATNDIFKERYNYLSSKEGIKKIENSNPFQSFYLRELLMLSFSNKILSKKEFNLNKITEIRNWVMHAKDIVKDQFESELIEVQHPVYNIEGLLDFIERINSFFKSYDQLVLKLDGMASR